MQTQVDPAERAPKAHGVQHARDGRWYAGFTATRSPRMIWTRDKRQAHRMTHASAAHHIEMFKRHGKPVAPEPVELGLPLP